nr:DUF1294 domain-containing protein [bacterium]
MGLENPVIRLGLLVYALGINLAAFFAMGFDKMRARRGGWRLPEKLLFGLAALGGSIGGLAGMAFFHHKTRHACFRWGMPALLLLNLAAAAALVWLLTR